MEAFFILIVPTFMPTELKQINRVDLWENFFSMIPSFGLSDCQDLYNAFTK